MRDKAPFIWIPNRKGFFLAQPHLFPSRKDFAITYVDLLVSYVCLEDSLQLQMFLDLCSLGDETKLN